MKSLKQEFRMVSVSDLHFGNPRIDSEKLYLNLVKYFYPEVLKSHLVTINGDIYDQLLAVNSPGYYYITKFINDLFYYSDRYGIQIRLLHGTYSHDRDQLDILESLAWPNTRYRIIKNIESEVITEFRCKDNVLDNFELTVGYVPDNLPYREVQPVVKQLSDTLVLLGKDKLDLLIGHGTFAHTLPPNIPLPPLTYTVDTFKDIVKGIIVMGHIHVMGHKDNVYYCGSFERMSHNEEGDKGFYSFTYKDKWVGKFRVNKDATKFNTYSFTETEVDKLVRGYIDILTKDIGKVNKAYVRVIHPSVDMRAILQQVTRTHFPNVAYQSKAPKDVEKKILKVSDICLDIKDSIKPTKDNLGDLVYQFLTENGKHIDFSKDDIINSVDSIVRNM